MPWQQGLKSRQLQNAWFRCMMQIHDFQWFKWILLSHTSLNDRVLNQIGTFEQIGSNFHDHTWMTEYYNDQLSTRSLSIHQWKYFQKNLNAQFTAVLSECSSRGPQYLRLEISLYIGWIPGYFETFNSSQNGHFWRKITKMIAKVNFLIFTNPPYIWISLDFSEKGHSDKRPFR